VHFALFFRYTSPMQVNLTPYGEQLLREALAHNPGRSPEEILEQALAQRVAHHLPSPPDPVWLRLNSMPGVKLPDHWPPQFENFEPVKLEGESVSEQLIRERR
jgi:hypothetical protein